jgi:hypothetical protein
MRRAVFLLLFAVVGGISFAADKAVPSNDTKVFSWDQYKDSATEWGKWLYGTKPYWDRMVEGAEIHLKPMISNDMAGASEEEFAKKVNAGYRAYYKAIQNISPPSDLAAYHSKIVELFAQMAKGDVQTLENDETIKRLGAEAMQELRRVFEQHGVPQATIDEFASNH